MFRWGNRTSHLVGWKTHPTILPRSGIELTTSPHTVASNMVKVSHALNHSATTAMNASDLNRSACVDRGHPVWRRQPTSTSSCWTSMITRQSLSEPLTRWLHQKTLRSAPASLRCLPWVGTRVWMRRLCTLSSTATNWDTSVSTLWQVGCGFSACVTGSGGGVNDGCCVSACTYVCVSCMYTGLLTITDFPWLLQKLWKLSLNYGNKKFWYTNTSQDK